MLRVLLASSSTSVPIGMFLRSRLNAVSRSRVVAISVASNGALASVKPRVLFSWSVSADSAGCSRRIGRPCIETQRVFRSGMTSSRRRPSPSVKVAFAAMAWLIPSGWLPVMLV